MHAFLLRDAKHQHRAKALWRLCVRVLGYLALLKAFVHGINDFLSFLVHHLHLVIGICHVCRCSQLSGFRSEHELWCSESSGNSLPPLALCECLFKDIRTKAVKEAVGDSEGAA